MLYQKVHNRCAFTFVVPNLEVSKSDILEALIEKGFKTINTDIVKNARELIGVSKYGKGARMSKAPLIVDCSSLIKWLYGIRGIWLPRNLFLWQDLGERVNFDNTVDFNKFAEGDIVFTTDVDYIGVGHVGLATGKNTMIHATNHVGVEEIPFESLMKRRLICMIRRIVPKEPETVTLLLPIKEEIETSDDIEWLVRNSLARQRK
ncbi:MAG: NlpC/P60 family protein [Patescibacteria group bacterium]